MEESHWTALTCHRLGLLRTSHHKDTEHTEDAQRKTNIDFSTDSSGVAKNHLDIFEPGFRAKHGLEFVNVVSVVLLHLPLNPQSQ